MNIEELLNDAVFYLKKGNDVKALEKIKQAKKLDFNNEFQNKYNEIFDDITYTEDKNIYLKFRSMCNVNNSSNNTNSSLSLSLIILGSITTIIALISFFPVSIIAPAFILSLTATILSIFLYCYDILSLRILTFIFWLLTIITSVGSFSWILVIIALVKLCKGKSKYDNLNNNDLMSDHLIAKEYIKSGIEYFFDKEFEKSKESFRKAYEKSINYVEICNHFLKDLESFKDEEELKNLEAFYMSQTSNKKKYKERYEKFIYEKKYENRRKCF